MEALEPALFINSVRKYKKPNKRKLKGETI